MSESVEEVRGAPVAPSMGEGRDQLVLRVSQDAYGGDAQFTVSVNGERVGGVLTASALRADGASDTFFFRGDWGSGPHEVEVAFVNDLWHGTDDTDRNLHIEEMVYHGLRVPDAPATLHAEGGMTFTLPSGPAEAGPGVKLADWNTFNFFWDLPVQNLHGWAIKDIRVYLADSEPSTAVVQAYRSDDSLMGKQSLYTDASEITAGIEILVWDDPHHYVTRLHFPIWINQTGRWTSYTTSDATAARTTYDNDASHSFWIRWHDDHGLAAGVGPYSPSASSGTDHWPY